MKWKTVAGFPSYKISDTGLVYSLLRGRILKGGQWKGYPQVWLTLDGKVYRQSVHRLVAQAFIPNPLNLPQVNHKDCSPANGKPCNNAVSNLEWVTVSENVQHAYDNGLMAGQKGKANGNCKLSDEQVEAIRECIQLRIPQRKIAKQYGISQQTVSDINVGRRRK